jgi:hypothetical protein
MPRRQSSRYYEKRPALGQHGYTFAYVVKEAFQHHLSLEPHELTLQEVKGLTATPEQIDVLDSAARIVGNAHKEHHQEFTIPNHDINVGEMVRGNWVSSRECGLNIRYEKETLTLHPDLYRDPRSSPSYPKFMAWWERRLKIGADYGRIIAVIAELSKVCKEPHHVRYFLPGIQYLASLNPTLSGAFSQHFAGVRPPNVFPSFSKALNESIKKAMLTITQMQMIAETTKTYPTEPALIDWRIQGYYQYCDLADDSRLLFDIL